MTELDFFHKTIGNRDPVFEHALSHLSGQKADFLEIGCLRRTGQEARHGDGYSTFFFAEYVQKYGGSLTVCDIDSNAINVAKQVILPFFPFVNFFVCSGLELLKLKKEFTFVYLDGGDDPLEMLEEFQNVVAQFVLCDDFSSKGVLLRQVQKEFILYYWRHAGHQLALFGAGPGRLEIQNVQKD